MKTECHQAKTATRTLKGTVLFTVISVMLIMVVFLLGTMVLAYSANNRSFVSYQTSQTTYTARAAVESILCAMEQEAHSAGGAATPVSDALLTLTRGDDPIGLTINVNDTSMASRIEGSVALIGARKIINADGEEDTKDVVKISATAFLGNNSSTSSVYLLKDPVTPDEVEPGEPGSPSPGFNSGGGAASGTGFNAFGGTAFGIDDIPGILTVGSYGCGTVPSFSMQNDGKVAGPLTCGGHLRIGENSNFVITDAAQGIAVYGDLTINNSNKKFTSLVNLNDYNSPSNALKYQEIPYLYVDGDISWASGAPQIGTQDAPINIYAGTITSGTDASGGSFQVYGDIYLYEEWETPYSYTQYQQTGTNVISWWMTYEDYIANGYDALGYTWDAATYQVTEPVYSNVTTYVSPGVSQFGVGSSNFFEEWISSYVEKTDFSVGDYVGGNIFCKGNLTLGNGDNTSASGLIIAGDIINISSDKNADNTPDNPDGVGVTLNAKGATIDGAIVTSGWLQFSNGNCDGFTINGGIFCSPDRFMCTSNTIINGVRYGDYEADVSYATVTDRNAAYIAAVNNAASKVTMANTAADGTGDWYLSGVTLGSSNSTLTGTYTAPAAEGELGTFKYRVTVSNDTSPISIQYEANYAYAYLEALYNQVRLFPAEQERAAICGVYYHFYDENGDYQPGDADYDEDIGTKWFTDSDGNSYQISLSYDLGKDVFTSAGFDDATAEIKAASSQILTDYFANTQAVYDSTGGRTYTGALNLTEADLQSFGCNNVLYSFSSGSMQSGIDEDNLSEVTMTTLSDLQGTPTGIEINTSCTFTGTMQNNPGVIYLNPTRSDIWVNLADFATDASEDYIVVNKNAAYNVNFYVSTGSFGMNKLTICTSEYYRAIQTGEQVTIVKNPTTEEEKLWVPNIYLYCSSDCGNVTFSNNALLTAYIYAPETKLTVTNTSNKLSDVYFKSTSTSEAVEVTDGSNQLGIIGSAFFGEVSVNNDFTAIYIASDGGGGDEEEDVIEDGNGRVWQILYYSDY